MAEFNPIPLEQQLASKLDLYQGIHREFYQSKRQVQYLGAWLFQLSGELGLLQWKISQEAKNEQLEAFDRDEYFEAEYVVL